MSAQSVSLLKKTHTYNYALTTAYCILLGAGPPPFVFNPKDAEIIIAALRTKMAFYASLVPGITLTITK